MKYLINYYAAIILPFAALLLLNVNGLINADLFIALILIYALIYHELISGLRLIALGAIKKEELKKVFIPGWLFKHFGLLFFNIPEK